VPGIVGLITKMPRGWAESQLAQMRGTLQHELFYTTGMWTDESLGVYLGWTAHENSFSDGMPLSNEKKDVILVFSGEEFTGPEAARRLKEHGHAIEGGGPCHLAHLYEEDRSFPASLDGLFHGVLVDRTRGTATLFNDRYGMHRIYYHESKHAFYFAAEAKAILTVCPELRKATTRSLGEFVACSCVLQDRTLFEGVYRLPAASIWTFRHGSIDRKSTYFQPREWEEQSPLDPETYYQGLRDAVSRTLPSHFNGPRGLGIALTGGLDTRILMAWQGASSKSLFCYTFGGMVRDSQDVLLARRIANICGKSHQVISVGGDFLKSFPHYAEQTMYLTEGTVDLSRSPDLYSSERAREIAPVKVVGTYGSEIIRQAPMFKPAAPMPGLFHAELVPYIRQAETTYAELRREHPLTFSAFRQSPWYHSGVLALEQSQLTVRSPFLSNDFVRAVFRAPKSAHSNGDVRLRLIGDGNAALAEIRSDRGIGGGSGPFSRALSQAILEFSFKSEYVYDTGMPQWFARIDHLLSPLHLERLFLGRHKFHHFRIWYRDALSQYVREMLLDRRTLSRPYIERKGVEAAVLGHIKGDRNYTTQIHKLLSLELLHRLFLDPR
jgi:asparagine synthase (glutamine-hydrolysing)